jgi:EAL domain-containing protein (putative c-di-GMP-specific phosphodiesterase class I)
MTTISDKESGHLELAAFGLSADEIGSLRALLPEWEQAVDEAFGSLDNENMADLAAETRRLPGMLGDQVWQESWLAAWHKLHGQGTSGAILCQVMNSVLDGCARRLFSDQHLVSGLHVSLYSILRRSVLALIACFVELLEDEGATGSGISGELAALQFLHVAADKLERLAVLSVSLANRNALAHLSVIDLQELPGLLAGRLCKRLRYQDRLFSGREGEWILILPDIRSMTQPALASANIQREFSHPVRLSSGKVLTFDVLVGAAMAPEHGGNAESILGAARLARWRLAVAHETFGWFSQEIQDDWNKRFELAAEFKSALGQECLQLFLQPQIELSSGKCVGAELLLRWQRGNGEWVCPLLVMDVVDENGWRRLFTDWLFNCALRVASELDSAGIDVALSLNLTADDLLDEDLVEMVGQRFETWHLRTDRFTLELTESAMMQNRERCLETMRSLRRLGFRLALDDFGTGYSSLNYLVSLPINELKIDRSFIVAMTQSEEYLRIVRTIIDLAWDLEMMPLAEGVDDPAQVERLVQLGCNRVQGFLYAQAMPLGDFIDWYRSRQT